MWNIYGKKYDLTTFIKIHPGGSEILVKTKGLEDCTALFESYHAFSNIESIRKSLDKYEILEKDSDIKNEYNTDFTTYHKLIEKVKTVYPDRESIKASTSWYAWNISSILLYIYVITLINFIDYTFLRCFFSVIASSIEVSILFNLLHDGSHYAISTNPKVNNFISKIANSWVLWNHSIWFYHHIYYHHSFTGGNNDIDKDLYSINLFDLNKYRQLEIQTNIISTLIPGQLFFQIIWYVFSSFKNRLILNRTDHFKIPNTNHYDIDSLVIMFCKIYLLYNMGIIPSLFYMITGNTLYYLNVIADHDLYETHEKYYDGSDWAKRQICNSGNFMNGNRIWTMAFSGINHQIEHHLFPNICGHNYTYIAPIVEEFCKENNLPYVHHPTLISAYNSFMKKIKTS
uniref:Cytochrome b5 heme-binding domain-containing protein n=1 Tax=viral metagenome TaxID=1070528 RepID=A0A6C0ESA5_9ZZZZ